MPMSMQSTAYVPWLPYAHVPMHVVHNGGQVTPNAVEGYGMAVCASAAIIADAAFKSLANAALRGDVAASSDVYYVHQMNELGRFADRLLHSLYSNPPNA